MKKLIALVAALALLATMTMVVGATTDDVLTFEGTNITTTYTKSTNTFVTTVNANVGAQATILAFTGETLTTENGTNIEYINQEAKGETTVFTYVMKSDVEEGDTFTVKIGGSTLPAGQTGPYSQTFTIPASGPSTFTVSGTITDPALVEAGMDFDYVESEAGKEIADYFRGAWSTTVYLVADDEQHTDAAAFLMNYFGEDVEKPAGVATPVVADPTSGAFSFEGIANGNYILIADRVGALPILSYVTVNGADVTNISKSLINGDADLDSNVGGGDLNEVIKNAPAAYFDGDLAYSPIIDCDCDWNIGGGDLNVIIKNSGADLFAYNEQAIADVFALFE